MANTVTNVTTGKPAVAGAIWRAPFGTTLPADATSQLDAAFKCLGYCSDEGLSNDNSPSKETIKAWGGDVVLTTTTEKLDTFNYTLIEGLNVEVLKSIYGDDNVSGDLTSGITIDTDASDDEPSAYVIDMLVKGGKKRIVIPNATINELATITYQDNEAVGYGVTLLAMAGGFTDAPKTTHREYLVAA